MTDDLTAASAPHGKPDYELDETLGLTHARQYRALFEDTRREIISLLLERAATTSELAEVLGKPKGTVGHHLKVLADAGLVRVVRTKRVRALEAKYYGRTARVFLYRREHEAVGDEERLLSRAASEIAQAPTQDAAMTANVRYARIPHARAREWKRRMEDLIMEFAAEPAAGDTTYALVFGLYATPRPPLPERELSPGREPAPEDAVPKPDTSPTPDPMPEPGTGPGPVPAPRPAPMPRRERVTEPDAPPERDRAR